MFFSVFFVDILERHVDDAAMNCPYLLERCVVAIIRAAIHLLPVSEPPPPSLSVQASNDSESSAMGVLHAQASLDSLAFSVSSPSSLSEGDMTAAIWESMRLLKGVPGEVMGHLSDRLGAGLLTFLR